MSPVLAQDVENWEIGQVVPRVEVGEVVQTGLDWADENLGWLFDAVGDSLTWLWSTMVDGLLYVPAVGLVLVFAFLGWFLRSWQFGAATIVGMALVLAMEMWEPAMYTLAFVLIAAVIAVLISVPIGILAARNRGVSAFVRPILDFMQTMPAFVYLVPTVVIFGIGFVPGMIATIIFALPPGVRLTELGIRQVDGETVEAGQAFGATPRQILRGIQVPLATPTIMAGVNQVIMLALSMAVIAGFTGANGLGKEVVDAISGLRVPQGVEAGLAVVVLAIYLDRLTGAIGQADQSPKALKHLLRKPIIGGFGAGGGISATAGGMDRPEEKETAGAGARE